jgi:tRNA (mo5U34)-methyltransferase
MTLQSSARHDPEIAALGPWFHNLHLPDGRQTAPDHPLGDFPRFKWRQIAPHLPADLAGWSALDIGCNAGYYSFELARRGARVTGVEVEFRKATVYDLAGTDERWDLVLFMGVLYHLRHPLLALDVVGRRFRRLLVLQTLTMPGDERAEQPDDLPLERRSRLRESGWPKAAFIEHALAGDETNWWAPNAAGVEAMARSAGIDPFSHPAHEIWICRPAGEARGELELEAALRAVTADV